MIIARTIPLFFAITMTAVSAAEPPAEPGNGRVFAEAGTARIWSETSASWLEPEAFWLEASETASGRYWGRGSEYPEYREVSEHDTFLVVLPQGSCLMYFFHSRWRRAQDVRRWDEAQNNLLGCPHVFD